MLGIRSPISVLTEETSSLLALLPAVRDGSEDAVHDARVATRRIREALAIASPPFDERQLTELSAVFRRAGRALGRVRDADVAQRLLQELEVRFPLAATVTGRVRASFFTVQQAERRRLVKKLDGLDLAGVSDRIAAVRRHRWLSVPERSTWRDRLRAQLASRAQTLRQSVDHAAGVYLPNRAHAVRVAIKKLRYGLELADRMGLWHPTRAIRRLRKTQDALGQAHDRQMLLEHLRPSAGTATPAPELEAVSRFLEVEALALHGKYVDRRSDLLAICDVSERALRPSYRLHAILAAGLAVPPLLAMSRHPKSSGRAEEGSDRIRVDVRVTDVSRTR